jgi:hypothetical protein
MVTLTITDDDGAADNYSQVTTVSIPSKWGLVEARTGCVMASSAPKIYDAIIDIKPETLQIGSNGRWITCYIELPEDNVSKIDVSSIRLAEIIPVYNSAPTEIGDYDDDGALDLMVKFLRASVENIVRPRHVALTVSGRVGESSFVGSDTINVINPSHNALVSAEPAAPTVTTQTSTMVVGSPSSDNGCSPPVIISRENRCSPSVTIPRENVPRPEVSHTVENLNVRTEQMQISIPTLTGMTDDLRDAISAGKVGACVSIAVEAGTTRVEKEFQHELTITAKKVEVGNRIEMEVSSTSENGKTVVINVDDLVFPNLDEAVKRGRATVLFDNQAIKQAEDYADILDATNDDGAEYLVLLGARGAQVLVSIPHFSDHTITVASAPTTALVPTAAPSPPDSDSKNIVAPQSTVPTTVLPPLGVMFVAGVLFVAVLVGTIWRYLYASGRAVKRTCRAR